MDSWHPTKDGFSLPFMNKVPIFLRAHQAYKSVFIAVYFSLTHSLKLQPCILLVECLNFSILEMTTLYWKALLVSAFLSSPILKFQSGPVSWVSAFFHKKITEEETGDLLWVTERWRTKNKPSCRFCQRLSVNAFSLELKKFKIFSSNGITILTNFLEDQSLGESFNSFKIGFGHLQVTVLLHQI